MHCCFHEDKNASMSLNPKTGLFKCHGCQAQGDFIKFYMMKTGKAFKEAIEAMCQEAGIRGETIKPEKKRIECTYDYVDETGRLSFQVVRFTPKSFAQRVPNELHMGLVSKGR